jgi:hypothetical protein
MGFRPGLATGTLSTDACSAAFNQEVGPFLAVSTTEGDSAQFFSRSLTMVFVCSLAHSSRVAQAGRDGGFGIDDVAPCGHAPLPLWRAISTLSLVHGGHCGASLTTSAA